VTDGAAQTEGAVRPHRPLVSGSVNEPRRTDLIEEAERYLAAVELFRVEGCEPHWRREPGASAGSRAQRKNARDPFELALRASARRRYLN